MINILPDDLPLNDDERRVLAHQRFGEGHLHFPYLLTGPIQANPDKSGAYEIVIAERDRKVFPGRDNFNIGDPTTVTVNKRTSLMPLVESGAFAAFGIFLIFHFKIGETRTQHVIHSRPLDEATYKRIDHELDKLWQEQGNRLLLREELINDRDKLQKEIDRLTDKLKTINDQIGTRMEQAATIGIVFSGGAKSPSAEDTQHAGADFVSPATLHEKLERAQLNYPPGLLAELLAALDTHLLVVLSGPPGHGKTRIVRELAGLSASNAVQVEIIRVRPNWHDPADILGYANPLAPQTAPHVTNLVKALRRAEKASDENRLYIILLDEFNLAQVEHYFADFLSLVEDRTRTHLAYPARGRISLGYAIPDSAAPTHRDISPRDPKDLKELIKRQDYLIRELQFGSTGQMPNDSVGLPHNVRIIGTVNIDSSVAMLSPRVVDRSVVVQVGCRPGQPGATPVRLSNRQLKLRPLDDLPSKFLPPEDIDYNPDERESVVRALQLAEEGLREIEGPLKSLGWGVQLGPRRIRQCMLLASSLVKVLAVDQPEGSPLGSRVLDSLVRTMVFPRFMDIPLTDTTKQALKELAEVLTKHGCADARLELDALRARPQHTLNYWVY